jgi:hypothetical protein
VRLQIALRMKIKQEEEGKDEECVEALVDGERGAER